MRPPEGERGAALLTVLLMVAVIAAMAAAGLEKLRLSTRLATNAAAQEQARAFGQAAEALALVRVDALLRQAPGRITLDGGWSGRPFPVPLPGGFATVRVSDGGNCLNLNGLVARTGPGLLVAQPARVAEFARLLRLTGTPGPLAASIAAATADWIDTDGAELPGGAEDARYADGAEPYRTAGTLMADPSELRAVLGVTPAIYASVRPFVCALPVPAPATVNVDTLSPEQAPLVAALAPDTVGVAQAEAALAARPPGGFASAADFWRQGALANAGGAGDAAARTGVQTRWFAVDIDVAAGDARLAEHALLDASRLPPRLVSRQWGERP